MPCGVSPCSAGARNRCAGLKIRFDIQLHDVNCIAMELKTILARMKMTQSDCARAADITPQYINQFIRGKRPLTATVAGRIAKATGTIAYVRHGRFAFEIDAESGK